MNILVEAKSADATVGQLRIGHHTFDCTLGRGGVIAAEKKIEGDGTTPLGDYPLRKVLYRADRIDPQKTGLALTGLPLEVLTPETGWCEDPQHPDYNKQITLSSPSGPHLSMHDRMTRDDHLYDVVVVVGHNDDPPVPGKGSAIFIHLARPEFTPTAGCVGLRRDDLLAVLKLCTAKSRIKIRLND